MNGNVGATGRSPLRHQEEYMRFEGLREFIQLLEKEGEHGRVRDVLAFPLLTPAAKIFLFL